MDMVEKVMRTMCQNNKPDFDWKSYDPGDDDPIGRMLWKHCLDGARADSAAYKAALNENGFVIVPREPTRSMTQAAGAHLMDEHDAEPWFAEGVWQAMIEAAPKLKTEIP